MGGVGRGILLGNVTPWEQGIPEPARDTAIKLQTDHACNKYTYSASAMDKLIIQRYIQTLQIKLSTFL
jgi:hypothetical protein